MPNKFVMRGQTASGETEVLNFSGYKPGYAYRLVEFTLYPSTSVSAQSVELTGSLTAGKTAIAPSDPNFNNEGLIATSLYKASEDIRYGAGFTHSVVDDIFLITQNLILMVQDDGGSNTPINWQCRFVSEKMSGPEEAATNYKQYLISDGS